MPGPQSMTPQPVTPSTPRRHFTLAQANRSLPLVKRICSDIVAMHERATEIQVQLELNANGRQQAGLQGELDRTVQKLQYYVEELSDIGCELKDYRTGLVDFIGRHQGHEVCLCWKLGETAVGFWHELETGFAGRQPVSSLVEGN